MNEIEKFFLPPCDVHDLPSELLESGERPVLHLLRRDLEQLYLKENRFSSEVADQHKAPYLAAMGIFTGLDLMAKFYSDKGFSGDVFKKFLIDVCAESSDEADFAWDLRNAIHHSYSLSLRLRKNTVFTTKANAQVWHEQSSGINYVNLWGLKRFFFESIRKFKAMILADANLKARFVKKYQSVGRIFVLKTEKRPYLAG